MLKLVQGDHQPDFARTATGGLATNGGILVLIYQSLTTRRGTYWADPSFGSLLYTLREAPFKSRANLAKAHTVDALQWMVSENFARAVDAAATADGDRVNITVTVTPSVGPVWSREWEIQLNDL